jgi:hypothetical protein
VQRATQLQNDVFQKVFLPWVHWFVWAGE